MKPVGFTSNTHVAFAFMLYHADIIQALAFGSNLYIPSTRRYIYIYYTLIHYENKPTCDAVSILNSLINI
jgi:hypothetical protein